MQWQFRYLQLARLGRTLAPFLLLLIRIYWGWLLVKAGFGKLANLPTVAPFFQELGFPLPIVSATIAGLIELWGGLALLLGLLSRLTALLLTVFFLIAFFTAHRLSLSHPALFVAEPAFDFFFASLLIFCFGPGPFSIDKTLNLEN